MPECDGRAGNAPDPPGELPRCQVVMLTTFDDEQYVV